MPRRGITLIGLLAWAIVVGFIGYLLVRVVPTVSEFYTIQGVVDRIAASPASTVPEIRAAFDKQRQIDATIVSVLGKELDITKQNERVVISFAYEKEIELVGPVFLLIKYAGRSK
jgi:O-phosphoseryl-tRNA(Cys) synthetase